MTAIEAIAADAIREAAARVAAMGESSPRPGRDPVNLPMIRNWTEAIGDDTPVYTDPGFAAASVHGALVAPPAMIQVWTMPGLHGIRADDDPLGMMSTALDDAGYTSVVATNCDQVYYRYLRHGEQVSVRASLVDVTGPKRTALGEGWFVTTHSTWYAGNEPVAAMDFRILKFRPRAAAGGSPGAPAGPVMRPQISPDTEFFWAGTAAGELRIQRCGNCGALRHPPGPMCPQCRSPQENLPQSGSPHQGAPQRDRPGYVVAAGTGEVYSYVVHHHPRVPGKTVPLVIALVELPEGVRMVGELLGVGPEQVRVGLPVQAEFVRIDDDLTLPAWRAAAARPSGQPPGHPLAQPQPGNGQPAGRPGLPTREPDRLAGRPGQAPAAGGEPLPELVIEATSTFVISSALATRDFQDVHHDRDRAVARGSKDIFVNILTTTGLVQRFVAGWAGPQATFRSFSIRLGAPCYAGDTLTFSGHASEASGGDWMVTVTGRCSLGDHVTGTVRVALPARSS
ncbi:MAG TPA: OB-fold domain-containing protein [Streptosporangiaceae bacterium]|nr:OB-fold domain-containing protein [Streptosporangiaceae bacterium]